MDFSDNEYRDRLMKVFKMHQNTKDRNFDFFYQSQILWDESMAQSIDEFLKRILIIRLLCLRERPYPVRFRHTQKNIQKKRA